MGAIVLGGALAVGAAALLRRQSADPPDTYDFDGPAPGDLSPGITVDDNVSNYGIALDIPYRFSTDSQGFRASGSPENGRPTILVLGDSFAFGMGVGDAETFPHALRDALSNQYPQGVVWNAAVPGYTITDQHEQWTQKLWRLRPDLVIVCHTSSDLKEMARPTSFRRFMQYDDEHPETDPAVDAVVRRYDNKRAAAESEYAVAESALLARLGARAVPAFEGFRDAWVDGFRQLVADVRKSNPEAQIALVLWARSYGHGGLTTDPVRATAESLGVPVFQGQAALEAAGVAVDTLYLPDKHFSPTGNRLAAKQTARWLLDRHVLGAIP